MKLLKVVRIGIALSVVLMVAVLSACGGSGSDPVTTEPPPPPPPPSRVSVLWSETVNPLLQAELWTSQNNYDAAHVLMIPLHWAYSANNDSEYTDDFENYFATYVSEGSLEEETNQLRRLQYSYLHSQYLKLKTTTNRDLSASDEAILEQLLTEVEFQWLERLTSTYGFPTFPTFPGMKERFVFKMNTFAPDPEYARAIFDEEFYLLTIAADLMVILEDDAEPGFLAEIQETAFNLFNQEGLDVDEGWMFQPGVWSHHEDYIYSGHTDLVPDLEPLIIEDIGTDSSHFHRMPLWIRSLRDSYDSNEPEYAYYDDVLQRINWQLNNVILVPADNEFAAPRFNNFTDGWNGIYRYGFDTVGQNLGFEPYGISGVIPYSWYAFLPSEPLLQEYSSLEFPLPSEVVEVYVGPNTTRVRHPLVTWPDYFENGFAELNILLATDIISQTN